MNAITIKISPKVAAVLGKVSDYEKRISEILTRFLEAVADGRLTLDEIFSLANALINFARTLAKK